MRGQWVCWSALQHIVRAKGQPWYGRVLLWQDGTIETHLSALWDEQSREAWFLISDRPAGRRRVQEYGWRMRVEATFEDSKSRGWHLEASWIEDRQRLNRLLLAMWWLTHLAAACLHHGHRERFDRHDRRDKGIFRLGRLWLLDILRRARTAAALLHCLPFQKGPNGWRFALRF